MSSLVIPPTDNPGSPSAPDSPQLAPAYADAPPQLSLPAVGLSPADVSTALQAHANLPRTRWEEGRVSGAVYNGTPGMSKLWQEAFDLFTVSNPLHADGQSPPHSSPVSQLS